MGGKKRVKDRAEKAAKAAKASIKKQKERRSIVLRAKSKFDRKNVLEQLKKVQLPAEQIEKHFHSTSSMQTKGLKRFVSTTVPEPTDNNPTLDPVDRCLDNAANLYRRKKRIKLARNSDDDNNSSSSEDTDAVSTDTEVYDHDDEDGDQSEANVKNEPVCDKSTVKVAEQTLTHDTLHNNVDCNTVTKSEDDRNKGKTTSTESDKQDDDCKGFKRPAVFVPVDRLPEVEETRLKLPIIGEEQVIMEKIRYNDVCIISGETGSGKTTQLPQFLYEAGYTLDGKIIGITEPRRVAAVSMSKRVAHELNLNSDEVGYQIRFSGNVSPKTVIKFMTDGVLLRECQQDFSLKKYSVLIIDEAHERSVFSDILIGLLSRIVPLRAKRGNPLKLIIMSATLRLGDFTENTFLFKRPPPIIKIDARQFPVNVQFERVTKEDYIDEAYKKIRHAHKLEASTRGGILVFVTGKREIEQLCDKLKGDSTLHCLGLHALLPIEKQRRVFEAPPKGTRLCVIATNVAETSITIPNIKYVIDTGKEKKKVYDLFSGVCRFTISWIAKSSAEQRMGRAGRMGPGICYRLYSSAIYTNEMSDFAEPQILQKPVEDILLQMKSMNIDNVVNFPFPTRPSTDALKSAEKKLILLGALDDSALQTAKPSEIDRLEYASKPTLLGKTMAKFAVSARCSKMIVLSPPELISHVVRLVATLTVREIFLPNSRLRKLQKKWAGQGNYKLLGDFMVMIRAIMCADRLRGENNAFSHKRCLAQSIRTKAMKEIDKLSEQLTREVSHNLRYPKGSIDDKLSKLSESQTKLLRQLLLSSFCDHVAKKIPDGKLIDENPNDPNSKETKRLKNAYECMETDKPVYIDSESVLKGEHPEFVIYRELHEGPKKMYMRDVAVVEPAWMPYCAVSLCKFSDSPSMPRYDPTTDQIVCQSQTIYGSLNWNLGSLEVPMHLVDPSIEVYKHFTRALLNGEVLLWFKTFVPKLLSPPNMITKQWAEQCLPAKAIRILKTLVANKIRSKKDLIEAWRENTDFLKKEYLPWIPEALHRQVEQSWERILESESK